MELTLFLAKVIGWYFVIMSIFVLARQESVKSLVVEVLSDKALMFSMGALTLILGLILVVSHNAWLWGWPVIVTLIGWLTLFSGLLRLIVPEWNMKATQWWLRHPFSFSITALLSLLIGLYLLYRAYWG